jgi:DNA modification methylase
VSETTLHPAGSAGHLLPQVGEGSPRAFLDGRVVLHAGDCREVLRALPADSIDSVVCDPPYHLQSIVKRFGGKGAAACKPAMDGSFKRLSRGFMGQTWDGGDIAFSVELWAEVLRVLKPGGYLVAFSSSRTYHRMAVAIEDAGFVTHPLIGDLLSTSEGFGRFVDSLSEEQACAFGQLIDSGDLGGMFGWVFGQGFPKTHSVSKHLDKMAGAEREVVAANPSASACDGSTFAAFGATSHPPITAPASDLAKKWDGWFYSAQCLKPALEPIYMGQKPFSEKSGTLNVLKHGVGALNIEACKIESDDAQGGDYVVKRLKPGATLEATGGNWRPEVGGVEYQGQTTPGRWPANLAHDGSEEVVAAFPDTSPAKAGKPRVGKRGDGWGMSSTGAEYNDAGGSAARFFYSAKADADDRLGSKHPTVKPVDLMAYYVRLVTPKGGVVLDPFAGTGTTGEACFREGMRAVLIEREEDYRADITRRMELCRAGPMERKHESAKARGTVADAGPLFAASADGGG